MEYQYSNKNIITIVDIIKKSIILYCNEPLKCNLEDINILSKTLSELIINKNYEYNLWYKNFCTYLKILEPRLLNNIVIYCLNRAKLL